MTMTRAERLALFHRDLTALIQASNGMVIFNLAHDEDSYVQFSRESANEPLLCEVSNRSEGWGSHSLNSAAVASLRALGYEIPSPHHQSTPHKEFAKQGDVATLADEVEKIFRDVFRAAEDYEVVSNGVEQ